MVSKSLGRKITRIDFRFRTITRPILIVSAPFLHDNSGISHAHLEQVLERNRDLIRLISVNPSWSSSNVGTYGPHVSMISECSDLGDGALVTRIVTQTAQGWETQ
jgi:hypothetical protein